MIFRMKLLLGLIVFANFCAFAIIEPPKIVKDSLKVGWNYDGIASCNLSQAMFDNWAQGGENNFAWRVDWNMKTIYEQEKINLATAAMFSFGMVKVSHQESRKTVDEIRLQSVFTRKVSKLLNPYLAVTTETQSAKGYDYSKSQKTAISDFMDPAYFTQSLGMGYAPKPIFKTRLGAALKQTITSKYPRYADNPKTVAVEKRRFEVGVESVTMLQKKINTIVATSSELRLFSDLKGYRKIDVRWDNLLTAKINKFIAVNFDLKVYYDRDVSVKRQIKQALTIGLRYDFI